MSWAILNSDARHIPLHDESVQCVVTSPPYWGLRDYKLERKVWGGDSSCEHSWIDERVYRQMRRGLGLANSPASTRGSAKKIATVPAQVFKHAFCSECSAWQGCLGLEPFPEMFIEHIVLVFREIWRVLKKTGTIWVNMGDSYVDGGRGGSDKGSTLLGSRHNLHESGKVHVRESQFSGLVPKNLIGMPWRVALALQADGWILRRDIIWHKRNTMPESCDDRPTTAHEYIFLLAKSRRYYYDGKAIAEPVAGDTHARYARGRSKQHKYADGGPGNQTIQKSFAHMRIDGWHNAENYHQEFPGRELGSKGANAPDEVRGSASARFGRGAGWRDEFRKTQNWPEIGKAEQPNMRNSRSVWSMSNQNSSIGICEVCKTIWLEGAPQKHCDEKVTRHFAMFPEELAGRCIKAGSKPGDIILDPFSGAGTTPLVADKLERIGVGTELKPEYCKMSHRRCYDDAPLLVGEA